MVIKIVTFLATQQDYLYTLKLYTTISHYHELWHVEQSFRMSKSDLRARPIFHHLKDAIEAHLTIVMASLAMGRLIQGLTNLSVKKVVKILRPIHSGTISINGSDYQTEPKISEAAQEILAKLHSGH